MIDIGDGIEQLVQYGIKKARPRFCEVILSRFVDRIRREAKTVEDVDRIYGEMRHGKRDESKLRIVT